MQVGNLRVQAQTNPTAAQQRIFPGPRYRASPYPRAPWSTPRAPGLHRYFINLYPEDNGEHLVHREGCRRVPRFPLNLGHHPDCHSAVEAAKRFFPRANGCLQCARECHVRRSA